MLKVLHAGPVRLLLGVAGTAWFVQSSNNWSLAGLVLSSLLVIAAGADVAYSPAKPVGNA